MVSDYVMTQHDCQGRRAAEDPVGLAAYTMDSHNVQRYVDRDGHVRNEGGCAGRRGFPRIPSRIEPLCRGAGNARICWSRSAFRLRTSRTVSIRMEPVFMVLGESAAIAASMAIADDVDVQAVDYSRLGEQLRAAGQILAWPKK